ncbi:MAG: prephenate dehydratase [Rhodospirillaceae bacterium]|nr:prephenate dehydratase [Rhodospirillaceae bacterium]
MKQTTDPRLTIAYQGVSGANSHLACQATYPDMTPLSCANFEDLFAAVKTKKAIYAMIPIENSVMGRVADIHNLLPGSGLSIISEHFQPVRHNLLAIPGATLETIKRVESQMPALSQCRKFIRDNRFETFAVADTAGAARDVAKKGDPTVAAIASSLAASIYKLQTISSNIEDAEHNTTRFLIMCLEENVPQINHKKNITSFVFHVKNVPSALYKALGGFATNNVNITKLESYFIDGDFIAAQFYVDVEGHQEEASVKLAIDELKFYSKEIKILGSYPAHPFRTQK